VSGQPLLSGDQIDPYDILRIETLTPHILVNSIVGSLTINTIGFAIVHMHDMVMRIDGRKGLGETLD
jgi:hypothetical protein